MSTEREQVSIELSQHGYSHIEIEDALKACKSQGLLYNREWCLYYLKEIKQSKSSKHNKSSKKHKSLLYLSDLNASIFGEIDCDGFILNGHKNERTEMILDSVNKIFDILFDFYYETQLRNSNNKVGFRGRLNRHLIQQIVSDLHLSEKIRAKFASILNLKTLYLSEYGRDEFNILFRLISMHQNQINQSFMTFLDYQTMIVKLPKLRVSNHFLKYLQSRFPKWKTVSNSDYSNSETETDSDSETEYMNLNEFENENNSNDSNAEIYAHLFKYYLQTHTHTESNPLLSQDMSVDILVSSQLSQHILEIIWNESKHNLVNNGMDRFEFTLALHLVSLAQQRLPYNKNYLQTHKNLKYIPLPSILIDANFVKYYKSPNEDSESEIESSENEKNSQKRYERPLSKLIPYIPESHIDNFLIYFTKLDRKKRNYLSGTVIGRFFRKSQLSENLLAKVWDLSDIDNDGKLNKSEFCIAMHLINCVRQGAPLPNSLPHSLTHNAFSHYSPFDPYLSAKDLSRLQRSDCVDFRLENGKFLQMRIVQIQSQSNLLLQCLADSRSEGIWCNCHTATNRIAKHKSITQRPVTRKNMVRFRVGDIIDINPQNISDIRLGHTGWKLGKIMAFDFGQTQIKVRDSDLIYWVHLDNPFEVAPPNMHSQMSNSTNSKKQRKSGQSKAKHKHKNQNKNQNSHKSSKVSETDGFVMINYPTQSNPNTHTTDTHSSKHSKPYRRPVVQFGGNETEKEVQYVLKNLNNTQRKYSIHSVNVVTNPNNARHKHKHKHRKAKHRHHKSDNYDDINQRYHFGVSGANNNNQSNTRNPNTLNLYATQHYSNTAPSTPVQLTVKRYKYREKSKRKSKHVYV